MFSVEQIDLMNKNRFGIDFSKSLTEDDYFNIENMASDILQTKGIGKDDELNSIGLMAESIIDVIPY